MPIFTTLGAACAKAWGFTSGLITDQYFNLVSLLLPGNGTNGAQNNTFLDSSSNTFTITRNGNTTQGTFSPFSQTGWGAYFDGASDYIQYTNSDFSVSTGDFTAEWWMYVTSDKSQVGIMTAASNANLTIGYGSGSANARQVYVEWGGTGAYIGTMSNYANTWVHICVMRSSGTVYTFQNGTLLSSAAKSAALGSTANMVIGTNSGDIAAQSFPGYLSNVRFSKAAVYSTSGFTPITSPLTRTSQGATNVQFLTLQSNRLLDSNGVNTPASSPLTITRNGDVTVTPFSPFAPTQSYSASAVGGSGYFDGTGDYLSAASNAAFALGTGDFTIEFWLYPTSTAQRNVTFATVNAPIVFMNTSRQLELQNYGIGGIATTTNTLDLNAWNHCVATRQSGTLKLFINGVQGASVANSSNWVQSAVNIGTDAGTNYCNGYMTDVRILKGTGYSTITVPTAPLTAITNTSLLLNFTNAGVVDATAKNVLETVGNAQISTTQSKWGGGSMSFDGTANCRVQVSSSAAPPLFNMGTGDYTVEFWMYAGTPGSQQVLFDFRNADVSGQGVALNYTNSRTLVVYMISNRITSSAITANTWTHVALVRASGTYTLYVNGASTGGTWANSDAVAPPANRPYIGCVNDGSQNYNGYIDDFRITKSARYTSNFTAPTAPFPVQ